MVNKVNTQGLGAASRLCFDVEKLKEQGWQIHERESVSGGRKRTILTFETPTGKKLKSGKDVEALLKEQGLWKNMQLGKELEDGGSSADSDYEPPEPPSKKAKEMVASCDES